MGTAADFGTGQPIGCKGKVDLLFVISRLGTMSTEQAAAAVALWTCGGGQEAHFGAVLVESSVGDKTMDVDIQTEVTAQSLDYCEHAGTERLHGGEAVALLHRPAHVLHHRPRAEVEALGLCFRGWRTHLVPPNCLFWRVFSKKFSSLERKTVGSRRISSM